MKLQQCPECSNELTTLQSSGRQLCRSCGWTNKPKQVSVDSTSTIDTGATIIPIGIEIIDLERQSPSQKFHYCVKLSDGTQQDIQSDIDKFLLDFIVWSWRINNHKSEKEYVTFGIDFSELYKGIVLPEHKIKNFLILAEQQANGFDESWRSPKLNLQLHLKLYLMSEIYRYFREQRKENVSFTSNWGGGIKIISKTESDFSSFVGIGVLIVIFGGCVSSLTTPSSVSNYRSTTTPSSVTNSRPEFDPHNPDYIRSVQERSGIGEKINSVEEVVRACMVMAQDNGMSYSQAYERCN